MRINHLAIWARDLELLRDFYMKYFNLSSNEKYVNPKKGFSSYFLTFDGGGASLELMHRDGMADAAGYNTAYGFAHFAVSLGSEEAVNVLTERLRGDGYAVVSEPRTTGDGFYESAVTDPEGNYVELTV